MRTIATVLTVEADSAAAARRQVEDYGIPEAWADFDHSDKSDDTRIRSVKRAKSDA